MNDHLGSAQVLVDSSGKKKENLSFSAWGERRAASFDPNGAYTPGLNLLNSYALTQGFTGHEQDDAFGFINMKGRIYDPKLGRFLSADPFVQEPGNTQSYNRYSYVVNNPLSFTDPTGYLFSGVRNFIRNNFEAVRTIVAIASILMPGSGSLLQIMAGAATNSFILTAIATGSLESGLQAGVMSGLAAGLSAGFASAIGGSEMLETAVFGLGKYIAHGVTQGVVSLLQGGKFRDGFIGGFFGHAAGKLGEQLGFGRVGEEAGRGARTVVAAMVGGLVSKHTGGKFANGAITAAFTHLFNAEASSATTAPANLEDIPVLNQLQGLANQARDEVDANAASRLANLPAWLRPMVRGTLIHSAFAAKVKALGAPFDAEISYKNHRFDTYSAAGTVRADAIYGDKLYPKFVVELKTGIFNYMSAGEAKAYLNNLPLGTDVYPMYTDKFLGYFPRGQ